MSFVVDGQTSSAVENGTDTLKNHMLYDHFGATMFVVIVCCVYALAIFFMIASHLRRRSVKRDMDRDISLFLQSQSAIRQEEELQRRQNMQRSVRHFIGLTGTSLGQQTDHNFQHDPETFNCKAEFACAFSENLLTKEIEKRVAGTQTKLDDCHRMNQEKNSKSVQCCIDVKSIEIEDNISIGKASLLHNHTAPFAPYFDKEKEQIQSLQFGSPKSLKEIALDKFAACTSSLEYMELILHNEIAMDEKLN